MNVVMSGGNDKEGEGEGQLAHRRDMLKDGDDWEYSYHGEAKAHVGIPQLRACPCAGAMSAAGARVAVTVPLGKAKQ